VHARIVRIGNSRGLRIPRALLEECGIRETVELTVEQGCLVVRPVRGVREGWAEAARAMAERGDDHLRDPELPTEFDEADWEW
jgi:antitoxin MazE